MKDIMSIKKRLEQKSAINGKAGVAIMSDMLNDEKIRNLVIKHYNSITCENEMKPEIILGDVPVFSVGSWTLPSFVTEARGCRELLKFPA
jgi:GH35 family endo-1,4-beta-xylanase